MFNREELFDLKYIKLLKEKLQLNMRSVFIINLMSILSKTARLIINLGIIYLSAKYIIEGVFTIGSFIAFNTYIGKLFDTVSSILSLNISFQSVKVSMDRLDKIMSEPSEINDCMENIKENSFSSIRIDNLSFGYLDKLVINGTNLSIPGSGFYAIVGKNGSGKSTLVDIVTGLYKSSAGDILFNGQGISEINLTSLRENILYLTKESFFTNDSIVNNLRLVNDTATASQIEDVCKKVGLHDCITSLLEGYDTRMGNFGLNFSSGKKQRLGISRALLKESKILILDEITSDLDGNIEKQMMELIKNIAKTKIVIFISHKISTIQLSDKIFVMDNGKVVAEGTHTELAKTCDLYMELFK